MLELPRKSGGAHKCAMCARSGVRVPEVLLGGRTEATEVSRVPILRSCRLSVGYQYCWQPRTELTEVSGTDIEVVLL